MSKLTVVVAKRLSGRKDPKLIKKLNASNKSLTAVSDLSSCRELVRLDLSHNTISVLGGVVHCTGLTWLDLSHNQLNSLDGIQNLVNLVVLRASHNTLTSFGELSLLKNLKALILNDNQLSLLQGLTHLKQLNTLVLSHNSLESVSVKGLPQLKKLSLSHNNLKALPNTQMNLELTELRLNDNKVCTLPQSLSFNHKLKILDLGNNELKQISTLTVLNGLRQLVNLNLKGNSLCERDGYCDKVLKLRPSLNVLDGKKRELGREEAMEGGEVEEEEEEEEEEKEDSKVHVAGQTQLLAKRKRLEQDDKVQIVEEEEEEEPPKKKRRRRERDTNSTELSKKIHSDSEHAQSSTHHRGHKGHSVVTLSHSKQSHEKKPKTDHVTSFPSNIQTNHVTSSPSNQRERGVVTELEEVGLGERKKRRQLKVSLKESRGRSGVVAVKTMRRRRKGRREEEGSGAGGGWDPENIPSSSSSMEVGGGRTSAWS